MRIPLIREKTKEVLKRSGFDPRSHAGKALMDILETYPRDELLHTPIDELAPMTEAAMHARERRAVRMFIRRDTYGRYVSSSSTCPATATTPVSASGSSGSSRSSCAASPSSSRSASTSP